MYAIAVKQTSHSSWLMHEKVYNDREKVDAIIERLKFTVRPYRVVRIFFETED